MSNLSAAAHQIRRTGIVVLPALRSQKRPPFAWRQYQVAPYLGEYNTDAICAVCGYGSKNLEVIDFDYKACKFEAWKEAVRLLSREAYEALGLCLIESTQSGGKHVAYRCEGTVDRNLKLCEIDAGGPEFCGKTVSPDRNGKYRVCAIETRGEGGLVLIAPTPGYAAEQGSWTNLPILKQEVRNVFIKAAVELSEFPNPDPIVQFRAAADQPRRSAGPAPAFDAAKYLREVITSQVILSKHGWTFVENHGENQEKWRRPGKTEGSSAMLDKESGMLWCFSSNAAPINANRPYTPLQLLAALEFNDDISKTSREVYRIWREHDEKNWIHDRRTVKNPAQPGHDHAQPGRAYVRPDIVNPRPDQNATSSQPAPSQRSQKPGPEQSVEQVGLCDFRSPAEATEFPEELLNPGGILGEMIDFTRSISRKWQPRLAFASALAGLSFHVARRVSCTETEVSPCVYALGISLPGTGKDAGRKAQRLVADSLEETSVRVHDSFESVQGLQNAILAQKKAFLLQDEFGGFLESVNKDVANTNRARIVNEFLTLFSSYYPFRYTGKTTAAEFRAVNRVQKEEAYYPALSIYGMTNPSDFRDAISEKFLKNGLAARFLYVWGESLPKRLDNLDGNTLVQEAPESLRQAVAAWHNFGNATTEDLPDVFCICAETERARKMLSDFERELDARHAQFVRSGAGEGILNFMGRLGEKSRKYAGLFACSRVGANAELLKYSEEDVDRALKLARYELALFDKICADEFSPSDALRILETCQKWMLGLPTGVFSQCEFTRRFKRFTVQERTALLQTLLDMDLVSTDKQTKQRPDGTFCGYKTIYIVNRPALLEAIGTQK